jgi:hypothetical protein
MPDFGQTGRNLAGAQDLRLSRRIRPERPDPRHLAGYGCSGRIPGQLAGNWPGRPVSGQLVGILPFCAGFRQSSQESGENGRIPATFAEIVYMPNFKKYFYIILY